jgi:hypothetical protein
MAEQMANVGDRHPALPIYQEQVGPLTFERAFDLTPVLCLVETRQPVDLPQQRFEPITSFRV